MLVRQAFRDELAPTASQRAALAKCAPQEALRDLDRAYANYWQAGKTGRRRVGPPRWKKRGRCPDRFRLNGAIRVGPGAVVLPRIGRDQGWAEFQRQLGYKTRWYGSRLVVAPRFYPSSKTCSGCGLVKTDLPLGVREFCCEGCGLVLDRDLNAAKNLAQLAEEGMVAWSSPETENACGGGSAGQAGSGLVILPSMEQERTRILAHTRMRSLR